MKNLVLCIVLFIALVISAAAFDYVNGDCLYRERLDEKIIYAELNADMHRKYNGYSIDELGEYYQKPTVFLGKTLIPMDVVNQHPELPVGCEVTCACAMLNFLGYSIDKCELTDNYLPIAEGMFTEKNGILYGPDPDKTFVGDPYGKGYGCYKQVIANLLDDYFVSHGSDSRAMVLEDMTSIDLERLIDNGIPVIVWASIDMKPYRYSAISSWITPDGEEIKWLANSHTLILTGYDASYYYFMDCNNKTETERYAKETFLSRWKENGSQAVAVKREN